MSKELLKAMLNNLINDHQEAATLDLHSYFVAKMSKLSEAQGADGKKPPKISIEVDKKSRTLSGSVWLDVKSVSEFKKIFSDEHPWSNDLNAKLKPYNLSFRDITDYEIDPWNEGYEMEFEVKYKTK